MDCVQEYIKHNSHCTLLSFWIAAQFLADLLCVLEGLNVLNAKRFFSPCWMLGLCKFLSSSSGRLIGRFIPFQPCVILLHLFAASSESVDWTVFSIILTIHHCEFSSLNSYRFIPRFNSRHAWVFFDIDLKGSHSTYVLLGLCKISALNSYRFLGRFFPWPAWVTLLNQGAPAQPSDCLNCSGA